MDVFRKLDSGEREKDFSRRLYHEFLMEHRRRIFRYSARQLPLSSHSICLLDVHSRLTAPCIICMRIGLNLRRIVTAYYENLTWELADKFYVNGSHWRTWDLPWDALARGCKIWEAMFFFPFSLQFFRMAEMQRTIDKCVTLNSLNDSIMLAKDFSFYRQIWYTLYVFSCISHIYVMRHINL